MGGIIPTKKPRIPRFDGNAIARTIKWFVPGAIIERTGKGIDMNGQPFAPYSRAYRNLLKRMGEPQGVDLRMSGGLIKSIQARGVEIGDNRVVVRTGPDTGTSPQYVAPSRRGELAKTSWDRGRGLFGEQTAYAGPLRRGASSKLAKALTPRRIRTEGQSPPHNIVAHWLHYGTGRIKARPFLGLTTEQTQLLFREIQKVMFRMR